MVQQLNNQISSLKNPWIQSLVRLQRASERREQGRFLLEGSNLVQAAIESAWPLECLLVTDHWSSSNRQQFALWGKQVPVQWVTPQVLKAVATTQTPEGIVAVANIVEQGEELNLPKLGIALDALQDPGNLGTLVRAAAASNADGVYLGEGSVDPYNDKLLRSTAGLWFSQRPQQVDLPEWIGHCRNSDVQVLGASAEGQAFWELDLQKPTLFVLGNEGAGLSTKIRQCIEHFVSVPMNTQVESLNVAMTGTLLLYEAMRQRQRP